MADIEDVPQMPGAAAPSDAGGPAVVVARRTRADGRSGDDAAAPRSERVFMHTFGCGHNVSDGEYMAGQLAAAGYAVTDEFRDADCYVINSCTVKNPSEDHFVTMLRRARATRKPVVVAGCVPQGDQKNKEWADVSVIGVRHIDQVEYVVSEAMQGNAVRVLSNAARDAIPRLALPKVRRNKLIEIIPINVGCLNFCTYCKTKQARGNLRSWPVEEIVARVRQVVAEGVLEIRMTSEDTGAYGIDIGTTVVDLLKAVVKELEGTRVMLRVGMSNPPYLLRQLEAFAEVLLHPNVFEFIHIPVQSGSNAILDVMKREYTVEEFMRCVETFKRIVPNVAIATDIICAFPGEGDAEWQETMELCRRVSFPVLNISRFYSRRDTPAAAMKQVPTDVSKKRSQELTALFQRFEPYAGMEGTVHRMLLTEVAHDKHHLIGHTKGFVQVLVDPAQASMGDDVTVRVTKVLRYAVQGVVVENHGNYAAAAAAGRGHVAATARGAAPSVPAAAPRRSTATWIAVGAAAAAVVVVGAAWLRRRRA